MSQIWISTYVISPTRIITILVLLKRPPEHLEGEPDSRFPFNSNSPWNETADLVDAAACGDA